MNQQTFTRDSSRKMLAGVVAGLQRKYLPQVDLTIFRVGVVILGAATGTFPFMVLAYFLLAVLAPEQ